ncbi:MAG: hypothetical protein ACLQGP_19555 [Isosphaeraceae bacterium]
MNRTYDLGVNSYLVKPFAPDPLVEMRRQVGNDWLVLNERPEIAGD